MTWRRREVAPAIVSVLAAVTYDGNAVPGFAIPPETFNPPAYVVGYPTLVTRAVGGMGIDLAELPVAACGGPNDADRVDELLELAIAELEIDPSLGGVVLASKVRIAQQSWRRINIAGAEVLAADLVIEIRQ